MQLTNEQIAASNEAAANHQIQEDLKATRIALNKAVLELDRWDYKVRPLKNPAFLEQHNALTDRIDELKDAIVELEEATLTDEQRNAKRLFETTKSEYERIKAEYESAKEIFDTLFGKARKKGSEQRGSDSVYDRNQEIRRLLAPLEYGGGGYTITGLYNSGLVVSPTTGKPFESRQLFNGFVNPIKQKHAEVREGDTDWGRNGWAV